MKLEGWHEFFLLLGTAAPVLMGLLFMSVSIRDDIRRAKNSDHLKIVVIHSFHEYLTGTLLALYFLIPEPNQKLVGGLVTVTVVPPLVVVTLSLRRFIRDTEITLEHYFWKFSAPSFCYLLAILAGLSFFIYPWQMGIHLIAVSVVALLIISTRNSFSILVNPEQE